MPPAAAATIFANPTIWFLSRRFCSSLSCEASALMYDSHAVNSSSLGLRLEPASAAARSRRCPARGPCRARPAGSPCARCPGSRPSAHATSISGTSDSAAIVFDVEAERRRACRGRRRRSCPTPCADRPRDLLTRPASPSSRASFCCVLLLEELVFERSSTLFEGDSSHGRCSCQKDQPRPYLRYRLPGHGPARYARRVKLARLLVLVVGACATGGRQRPTAG